MSNRQFVGQVSGDVFNVEDVNQDLVVDHSAGIKATLANATSTNLGNVPTGALKLRLWSDGPFFLRTDGTNASDVAAAMYFPGNMFDTIPVVPGASLRAMAPNGATTPVTIRGTYFKPRA